MMVGTVPDRVKNQSSEQVLSGILEEARNRYDEERDRSDTVENKIGTIITIDALIITLIGVVSALSSSIDWILYVGTIPALFSTGLGLWALRVREYERPGMNIEYYYGYVEFDLLSFRDHFLNGYIEAVEKAENFTAEKYRYFKICVILTMLSLSLVVGQMMIALIQSMPR